MAKFCSKCGNALQETERFCAKCGAPVDTAPYNPVAEAPVQPAAQPVVAAPAKANNLGVFYLATLGLQVLQLILWFCKTFQASAMGMSHSVSTHEAFVSDDMGFISTVAIILSIVGLLVTALPVVMKTTSKRNALVIPKITILWSTVWFIIYWAALSSRASDYSSFGMSAGPTFAGVLFLIVSLAVIVMLFKISATAKKLAQ